MDTVRFGRVLGSGARSAAKTLIQAVDAAKAENPSRSAPASAVAGRVSSGVAAAPTPPGRSPAVSVRAETAARVAQQGRGVRNGAARFRELAVKPFIRLSGVMVLEVVGVFFGVFAVYGLNTMWRAHAAWHSGAPNHRQFVGGIGMLVVFGYFCVTSFVRARRRERGR